VKLKVGLLQINTTQRDEVLWKVRNMVTDVKAHLYVLPELFTTGYKDPHLKAEPLDGPTVNFMRSLASKVKAAFVFSYARLGDDGKTRNTAVFVSPEGEVLATYDKAHLFLPLGEGEMFVPGESLNSFTAFNGIRFGLQICYDLRFPEAFRTLTLEGAKVVLIPAQWPRSRVEIWRAFLVARAAENGIFVVATNRIGMEKGVEYGGNSSVVSPSGDVLLRLGMEEVASVVEVNLDQVEKNRNFIDVIRDRKPDLYRVS